jgi:Domain of unknown function (DUF4314)
MTAELGSARGDGFDDFSRQWTCPTSSGAGCKKRGRFKTNMRPCNRGDRVRLTFMPDDPDPIKPGEMGTVYEVGPTSHLGDGRALHIWVRWDNGRSLNLSWPLDQFEVVESSSAARFRVVYETSNGRGIEYGIFSSEESLRAFWAKRRPERKILVVSPDVSYSPAPLTPAFATT